jgi:hypothetical protein
MAFWLAFGISEEFESGGGASVRVLDGGFRSFEDAVTSLIHADDPVVGGRVTEAHAYVVEADTIQQASLLVRSVFIHQESSAYVQVVQRNVRTQQMPKDSPESEALNRLHGELCIAHQITELALSLAEKETDRIRLDQHKVALEDSGYAVRVMRGDEMPIGTEAPSGSERLGYTNGQLAGAQSATFADALGSLTGELSIARHQADLTIQVVSPSHGERLRELGMELDTFRNMVTELFS